MSQIESDTEFCSVVFKYGYTTDSVVKSFPKSRSCTLDIKSKTQN